jgi:hypothetical protein
MSSSGETVEMPVLTVGGRPIGSRSLAIWVCAARRISCSSKAKGSRIMRATELNSRQEGVPDAGSHNAPICNSSHKARLRNIGLFRESKPGHHELEFGLV